MQIFLFLHKPFFKPKNLEISHTTLPLKGLYRAPEIATKKT